MIVVASSTDSKFNETTRKPPPESFTSIVTRRFSLWIVLLMILQQNVLMNIQRAKVKNAKTYLKNSRILS
ncbi:hypothetical protein CEXT_397721 [Caerostris extrusa]|uniref:Uncharacterized protein n=1 Tax=Caerostris extrusa TaxID=172846 RepID=A0AAV4XPQ7_CAEEX|nr:hypothetical protein CEXT_397721 [Caerostris extrusa]